MQIIRKCRIHKAVLWSKQGDSGRGYFIYNAPVQISCRWNQADEVLFDKFGVEFRCISDLVVDRDVAVGDILKYGLLTDIKQPIDDPLVIDGAYPVRMVEKLTTLTNADMANFDQTACFVYLGQNK